MLANALSATRAVKSVAIGHFGNKLGLLLSGGPALTSTFKKKFCYNSLSRNCIRIVADRYGVGNLQL